MGIHRPFRPRGSTVYKVIAAPSCFDSDQQWKMWREAARACAKNEVGVTGFCTDCTPEYQKQMVLEKRCEHPETEFAIDKDGFTGYWPRKAA